MEATRPARHVLDGPRNHPNDYSAAEDTALRDLWATATRAQILAALPGREWQALQRAAARRKLRRPRRPHNLKWEGEPLEKLRARYPAEGAITLAAELGFSVICVRDMAKAEGIQYQKASKGRPAKKARKRPAAEDKVAREARLQKLYPSRAATAKAVKPKKQAKPKPAPKPVVVAPEPVKRSPPTPILNARAEQRRLAEVMEAKKPKPFITAEQLKAAPQPVRWAYACAANRGPAAATQAFHEAMNNLKQVA